METNTNYQQEFEQANAIVKAATVEDNNGNLPQALQLYIQASHLLLDLLSEGDNEQNIYWGQKIAEILDRAEQLKHQIEANKNQTSEANVQSPRDAQIWEVILRIEKVACYMVNNSKETISDGTEALQMLKLDDKILLQIGNHFTYELNKSIPCMAFTSQCYYMFPGLNNTSYCIKFHKAVPPAFLDIFEKKLDEYCCLKHHHVLTAYPSNVEEPQETVTPQPTQPTTTLTAQEGSDDIHIYNDQLAPVQTSDGRYLSEENVQRLVTGIDAGGRFVSSSIARGGEYLKSAIEKGGQMIQNNLLEKGKDYEVPVGARATIKVAKSISPHAVKLSTGLVNSVSYVADALSRLMVTGVKHVAGRKHEKELNPNLQAAKLIGHTSMAAVYNVWSALEQAGMKMYEGTADATINIIHHKYGHAAGEVARDCVLVGKDILKTQQNLASVGPKQAIKHMAKHGASALLHSEYETLQVPKQTLEVPATAEQPKLLEPEPPKEVLTINEKELQKTLKPKEHHA